MKYYSYNEPIWPEQEEEPIGNKIVTCTKEDIRKNYYPYWRDAMIKKYNLNIFNENYTFDDCIEDWIIVNWAWESDDEGKEIK